MNHKKQLNQLKCTFKCHISNNLSPMKLGRKENSQPFSWWPKVKCGSFCSFHYSGFLLMKERTEQNFSQYPDSFWAWVFKYKSNDTFSQFRAGRRWTSRIWKSCLEILSVACKESSKLHSNVFFIIIHSHH